MSFFCTKKAFRIILKTFQKFYFLTKSFAFLSPSLPAYAEIHSARTNPTNTSTDPADTLLAALSAPSLASSTVSSTFCSASLDSLEISSEALFRDSSADFEASWIPS